MEGLGKLLARSCRVQLRARRAFCTSRALALESDRSYSAAAAQVAAKKDAPAPAPRQERVLAPRPELSYIHDVSEAVPFRAHTIGRWLHDMALAEPSHERFVFHHESLRKSSLELDADTVKMAASLVALGVRPGDRVGLWGLNTYNWLCVFLASARIGAIAVLLNPAYKELELEFALRKSGCKLLFVHDQFRSQKFYSVIERLVPELASFHPRGMPPAATGLASDGYGDGRLMNELHCAKFPALKSVVMLHGAAEPGTLAMDDVRALAGDADAQTAAEYEQHVQPDDPFMIQFTSGTTGFPKGAVLTHHNALVNAQLAFHRIGLEAARTNICAMVPFFHSFATALMMATLVSRGAKFCVPDVYFSAENALRTVQDERCAILSGTPTMYVDMLNHKQFAEFDKRSLCTAIFGGAGSPRSTKEDALVKLGLQAVTNGYGTTECAPTISVTNVHDPRELMLTTAGRPLPNIEVQVVDSNGRLVPVGQVGEICVRGPVVMRGYWEEPELSAQAIDAARWYHTGDLGHLDAQGYLSISGRIKELVIRGGENIYPAEVELFLSMHPAIADAHVVGVPDTRFGEELCAFVRPRPDWLERIGRVRATAICGRIEDGLVLPDESDLSAASLRHFFTGKLSHFKIPRYVIVTQTFPLTASGKVKKFVLRDRAIQLLHLRETH